MGTSKDILNNRFKDPKKSYYFHLPKYQNSNERKLLAYGNKWTNIITPIKIRAPRGGLKRKEFKSSLNDNFEFRKKRKYPYGRTYPYTDSIIGIESEAEPSLLELSCNLIPKIGIVSFDEKLNTFIEDQKEEGEGDIEVPVLNKDFKHLENIKHFENIDSMRFNIESFRNAIDSSSRYPDDFDSLVYDIIISVCLTPEIERNDPKFLLSLSELLRICKIDQIDIDRALDELINKNVLIYEEKKNRFKYKFTKSWKSTLGLFDNDQLKFFNNNINLNELTGSYSVGENGFGAHRVASILSKKFINDSKVKIETRLQDNGVLSINFDTEMEIQLKSSTIEEEDDDYEDDDDRSELIIAVPRLLANEKFNINSLDMIVTSSPAFRNFDNGMKATVAALSRFVLTFISDGEIIGKTRWNVQKSYSSRLKLLSINQNIKKRLDSIPLTIIIGFLLMAGLIISRKFKDGHRFIAFPFLKKYLCNPVRVVENASYEPQDMKNIQNTPENRELLKKLDPIVNSLYNIQNLKGINDKINFHKSLENYSFFSSNNIGVCIKPWLNIYGEFHSWFISALECRIIYLIFLKPGSSTFEIENLLPCLPSLHIEDILLSLEGRKFIHHLTQREKKADFDNFKIGEYINFWFVNLNSISRLKYPTIPKNILNDYP